MAAGQGDNPQPARGAVDRGGFVLRLWHEPGNGRRGQITHAQTRDGTFFRSQAQLWRFLRRCLHVEAGESFLEADTPGSPAQHAGAHAGRDAPGSSMDTGEAGECDGPAHDA